LPVNEITIDAPPPAVWEVLAEPPSYEEWVAGSKEIRDFDRNWPTSGTEFHHRVGFGPITVKDKTVSLEADPPRRLVMNVRALPFGHGIVAFRLAESGSGTLVRMEERPAGGPVKVLWPLFGPLVKLRNAETLRRLKRLVERRHSVPAARG
jgi:uncharacterized protein YndB with AHSA1/START domain